MKALWLEDRQLRARDDLPLPQTSTNEALVRVLQAGICNTDLEMVEGYYPFSGVPGHEFVGLVEDIGHETAQKWCEALAAIKTVLDQQK